VTVNTTPVEIDYTGNSSTTTFALPFAFAANAHVVVTLAGVVQNSGYSITGAGNPSGGALTFSAAPLTGVAVKARRRTPLLQDIDVVNNATVFASSLETGLDYALMRQQEEAFDLDALTTRAVVVPAGEQGITLPAQAARANKLPVFSTNGIGVLDTPERLVAINGAGAVYALPLVTALNEIGQTFLDDGLWAPNGGVLTNDDGVFT
jgi:hypothetical protein